MKRQPTGTDVLCVGEALVDWLPERRGLPMESVERWTRCLGGSPANVAVGVARLGARAAFLGVVGEDAFGKYLRQALAIEGVDIAGVRSSADGQTGLAFISLDAVGERRFAFYRSRAADLCLGAEDVRPALVQEAAAVHLGTNALLRPAARAMALETARLARAAGRIVSFDPNLRPDVWADAGALRGLLEALVARATVVKLAEDECATVTGVPDPGRALEALAEAGVLLPVVTRGARGAVALFRGTRLEVAAPRVRPVDTTGAGDGFSAGLLAALTARARSAEELSRLPLDAVRSALEVGAWVGARVTESLGAVTALPRASALPAVLRERLEPIPTAGGWTSGASPRQP